MGFEEACTGDQAKTAWEHEVRLWACLGRWGWLHEGGKAKSEQEGASPEAHQVQEQHQHWMGRQR